MLSGKEVREDLQIKRRAGPLCSQAAGKGFRCDTHKGMRLIAVPNDQGRVTSELELVGRLFALN